MDKYKKFHQQGHELKFAKEKIKQSLAKRMKKKSLRPKTENPGD